MTPKNEMIDQGQNPDDGSALMNGTDMPNGKSYHREHFEHPKPVMTVGGHELGGPEEG